MQIVLQNFLQQFFFYSNFQKSRVSSLQNGEFVCISLKRKLKVKEKMIKEYGKPRPVRLKNIEKLVDGHLKKTGKTFSVLVRDALRAYLKDDAQRYQINLASLCEELRKDRADLSKVGGDLNQLAFYFNTSGIVQENHLADTHEILRKEFKKIAQTFKKIERSLGQY